MSQSATSIEVMARVAIPPGPQWLDAVLSLRRMASTSIGSSSLISSPKSSTAAFNERTSFPPKPVTPMPSIPSSVMIFTVMNSRCMPGIGGAPTSGSSKGSRTNCVLISLIFMEAPFRRWRPTRERTLGLARSHVSQEQLRCRGIALRVPMKPGINLVCERSTHALVVLEHRKIAYRHIHRMKQRNFRLGVQPQHTVGRVPHQRPRFPLRHRRQGGLAFQSIIVVLALGFDVPEQAKSHPFHGLIENRPTDFSTGQHWRVLDERDQQVGEARSYAGNDRVHVGPLGRVLRRTHVLQRTGF